MRQLNAFYSLKTQKSYGVFNGLCALALLTLFFYNREDVIRNPSSIVHHRRMIESSVNSSNKSDINEFSIEHPEFCVGLFNHKGYNNSCEFLKAHPLCNSDSFFDYIKFYYCNCNESPFAYIVFFLWLAALFYLLGNTAADYFCCSLEKLSTLLKLSPTVAGVALLPLGNGAPDVFASIASFAGKGSGEVGLNSVLGGAVFVTCIVVGAVCLCISDQSLQVDRKCFIRDISFFISTLFALFLILIIGKISVIAAIGFVCIYVVYAFTVAANEILTKHAKRLKLDVFMPMSIFSHGTQEDESVYSSLLDIETDNNEPRTNDSLPQWMWASNVAIYSNQSTRITDRDKIWGWIDEETETNRSEFSYWRVFSVLELPLTIPRRLTIPLVEEETWSKGYATGSAFFAPILLCFVLNTRNKIVFYVLSVLFGAILAILAYKNTKTDHPPQRFVLLWVLGGFIMSIVWFYLIANELVALLIGLGVIWGINPSILGLTVLAWGNSMGDLVSNVALAMNGGDGVQIAFSGCYAGPMFNTLIGLGISMLLGSWSEESGVLNVPRDKSLYYTMGFLILGLVWALVVLPRNDMRPNRMLGMGLIAIYLVFLSFRLSSSMGFISFLL